MSLAGQDRRVVGAGVVEDGAKINSLKQQSTIICIGNLCWWFYMKVCDCILGGNEKRNEHFRQYWVDETESVGLCLGLVWGPGTGAYKQSPQSSTCWCYLTLAWYPAVISVIIAVVSIETFQSNPIIYIDWIDYWSLYYDIKFHMLRTLVIDISIFYWSFNSMKKIDW